jgi:hypothetical protein
VYSHLGWLFLNIIERINAGNDNQVYKPELTKDPTIPIAQINKTITPNK